MLRFPSRSHIPCVIVTTVVALPFASGRCALAQNRSTTIKPAEESRLSTAAFRAGLDKRGLTDLLELHIKDYPPSNKIEGLLMMRDIRRAEARDTTRPRAEREKSLAEANRIFENIIAGSPTDMRRFEWRYELTSSLIYEEADPMLAGILYREGGDTDRRRLKAITSRAVDTLTVLLEQIAAEFVRIDNLPISEFERLEASGYIDQVDRIEPKAAYLMLWARFYDALSRNETDPVRLRHLTDLADSLTPDANIIKTPHDSSHVQMQALLLAGMTHRRLRDHRRARQFLNRALRTADAVSDSRRREPIQWAVTLASIERVRNELDDHRYQDALRHLEVFAGDVASQGFGLRVVAALLERSIYRRLSVAALADHKPERAKDFRQSSWQALADLAKREPDHRDELYATLYASLGAQSDPSRLDPFEQSAVIAGLLHDADEDTLQTENHLRRAIAVADYFLAHVDRRSKSLLPEVLYNLAVVHYRTGNQVDAATRFIEVARKHPAFDLASSAAELAAQISASLYNDPAFRTRPEVPDLHRNALELLVVQFPDSDAGRYWRFYYAQLLEELGAFDEAAGHYALVKADHEHYLASAFARVRCLALALHERSTEETQDMIGFRRQSNEFLAAQRNFNSLASAATDQVGLPTDQASDINRIEDIRAMLGETRVLSAEVHILSRLPRPAQTLDMLEGFENEFPGLPVLAGRVWRVRLIAYQRLGNLDEAMDAIPAYIAADPVRAGPTLQTLYLSLAAAADERFSKDDNAVAQRKADMALVLAKQVYEWAGDNDGWELVGGKRGLSLQLAEANLRAGMLPRAKELFQSLHAAPTTDKQTDQVGLPTDPPLDVRFEIGYAETLFQLGEFSAALSHFNRLATKLPPTEPVRWKALLRDLQCRTSLSQPPEGIISVIQQQRFFHHDLGGATFAPQFEKLQRENQRRIDGA